MERNARGEYDPHTLPGKNLASYSVLPEPKSKLNNAEVAVKGGTYNTPLSKRILAGFPTPRSMAT